MRAWRPAVVQRRGNQDHPVPRPVADARGARPEQPRLGKTGRDRARDAPVLRSAPLRQRHEGLRDLPRAGAQLDRQPPARRRHGRAGSQHADAHEPARAALVRLGRRRRQPVVPEPAADPGRARAGGDAAPRRELLRNDEQLSCRYRKAFGAPPSPTDDEAVFVDVGKVAGRVPGDARQRTHAVRPVPRRAGPRGVAVCTALFRARAARAQDLHRQGRVHGCHSGPNFTNGEFFNTGLSRFDAARASPIPGATRGSGRLRESRFNLLGPYNDDPTGASADAHPPGLPSRTAATASSRCRPCAT